MFFQQRKCVLSTYFIPSQLIKMESKMFILIFLLRTYNTSAKISFVFDTTMQKYREKILTYQSDATISLDKSFFKLYNTVDSILNDEILEPYDLLNKAFLNACENFPFFSLENYAARRLTNICDEFKRFEKHLRIVAEPIISTYYPYIENLSAPTFFELIAEDYFDEMKKHLEYVVPIYNQNPICVANLFDEFFDIYQIPINKMIESNKKTTLMLLKATKKPLQFIKNGIAKLHGVKNKMIVCSQEKIIDTFGCVSGFVDFDCKKRKSLCGPVYKTMASTIRHIRKIETFNKVYDNSFDAIYTSINKANDLLLNWSNEVDKCVIICSGGFKNIETC